MTIKACDESADKFEPWMIDTALALFKEGESITSVCCDLDISRETYYRWRDDLTHPFSKVAKKGETLSQQAWERIGKQGVVGDLEKFGGSSWQFIMKNRFRDHYADQQKPENNSAVEMLLTMLANKDKE